MEQKLETIAGKRICLIIGYGSIGTRHARILSNMGFAPVCVSRREDVPWPTCRSVAEAFENWRPEVTIIATRTAEHLRNCQELLKENFEGILLVEKPLFAESPENMPELGSRAYVGYNLRFHPVVARIRNLLAGKEIFSAQFSVGQYLPDWRPGTDYRVCYSASDDGGVLRDLSHELDLALHFFGNWQKVAARCGRWGKLAITGDDTADILASLEKCPAVSIHLDYQNLFPERTIAVQADGLSMRGDLIKNELNVNGMVEAFSSSRDDQYIAQWHDILSGKAGYACTLEEGTETLRFIEAAERASKQEKWELNQ